MIIANKEGVTIRGETFEILENFAWIIHFVRKLLTETYGEKIADKFIADMGRIAVAIDEDGVSIELLHTLAHETAELFEKEGE